MKPVREDDREEIYTYLYICSVCMTNHIHRWHNYCPNCGHKINWEDEE